MLSRDSRDGREWSSDDVVWSDVSSFDGNPTSRKNWRRKDEEDTPVDRPMALKTFKAAEDTFIGGMRGIKGSGGAMGATQLGRSGTAAAAEGGQRKS